MRGARHVRRMSRYSYRWPKEEDMYGTGQNFSLDNDEQILQIRSPRESVGGPFVVVYKNTVERWVIVAMDWDGEPRLGIRWFWDGSGNPFSSGHATWLVIPPSLSKNVLSVFALSFRLRENFRV